MAPISPRSPKEAASASENKSNTGRAPAKLRRTSTPQLLDVQSVSLERISELRTCRATGYLGKDFADFEDVGSQSTSAGTASPPASVNFDGAVATTISPWTEWYSTSLRGFVVTEWYSFLKKETQDLKKAGMTRTLTPEEIVKVEVEIQGALVEAVCVPDGSSYTAIWSRSDRMRFPVQARVLVTYGGHNSKLVTRPLKVSLRDKAASQSCVLQ